MSDKPLYHGPDHRPGGPDPIPGLSAGVVQYDRYYSAADVLVAAFDSELLPIDFAQGSQDPTQLLLTSGTNPIYGDRQYAPQFVAAGMYWFEIEVSNPTLVSGQDFSFTVMVDTDFAFSRTVPNYKGRTFGQYSFPWATPSDGATVRVFANNEVAVDHAGFKISDLHIFQMTGPSIFP